MRRRVAPALLAAALATMALLPGAASAKPGYYKVPPSHILQLVPAHGAHGYRIDIAVFDGRPAIAALRRSGTGFSVVSYRQTKQRDIGDDLDADFGRAGRLKARFVPDKVEDTKAPKGCVGGPTHAEVGHFVGSLSFHGANGFTSFHAHRLRGGITRSPGLVCRTRLGRGPRLPKEEAVSRVIAGTPSGSTYFDAIAESAAGEAQSSDIYTALSRHEDGAVDILESVIEDSTAPTPLAIPELGALPATATIEPPAPFSGSATIEVPSRATATWSGDLAVDFPAAGEVPLTGPGIVAGVCRDYACSGSLPKALRPRRSSELGLGQVEFQTIR